MKPVLRLRCGCYENCWHSEDCPATPIFAVLCEEVDTVFGLLHDLELAAELRDWQFQQWWEAA